MKVAKTKPQDWHAYWGKYQDVTFLQERSQNLDETLSDIENEFGIKLLSGDHILIISALEDRIEELESLPAHADAEGVQGELF